MIVELVRHGATEGTEHRRYEGAGSDSPLSPAGARRLEELPADRTVRVVYTSGMRRCSQTASILFPAAQQVAVPDLREMAFGAFEGRAFADLADDAAYRTWVEGGCVAPCPGGEDQAGFTRRTVDAFCALVNERMHAGDARCVIVAHAGTVRAVACELANPVIDYFDANTPPAERWVFAWDGRRLAVIARPGAAPAAGDAAC
ncbi:histidine phosphatase family protein [Collinsella tanakaei]|uniref:histidine phosphatase family protein n=1 Tax=Collinsella tanakaei TaxID=626935 RepID=UPI0025A34020|nr:histidine phosphatase family protein [Collinsella tanakaei]MDM8245732.1 histidine phosphatase family protein [Collinsella tanakaei]